MEDNNQTTEETQKEAKKEVHHHHYPNKNGGINFGRLFLGILLVLIGVLYLANNMGWLDVNFSFDWWKLWPLIIVFFGLSIFSDRGWVSVLIGLLITLIVLGTVIGFIIFGNVVSFSDSGVHYFNFCEFCQKGDSDSDAMYYESQDGNISCPCSEISETCPYRE